MRRILLGALALAAMVSTATAADMSRRYEPVTKAPAFVPVYSWTGPYLGINGGGGWGTARWNTFGNGSANGGMFGVTAGYNWQAGQAVFGIEGDIDWTNLSGTVAGVRARNSWLGTVRGRLGYAMDRFMPYVTGGAAFGNVRVSRPGFLGGSESELGWTVGAGIEAAIAQNWTAKAEYLYVDLGKFNCGFSCGFAGTNVDFRTHVLRAGLNYRF